MTFHDPSWVAAGTGYPQSYPHTCHGHPGGLACLVECPAPGRVLALPGNRAVLPGLMHLGAI